MLIYKFLVQNNSNDLRIGGSLRDAHVLEYQHLKSIQVQDLFFSEGQLSQKELQQLALKLLGNLLKQTALGDELRSARERNLHRQ